MGKRTYSHLRANALAGTLVTTLLTLFCLIVTGTVNAHRKGDVACLVNLITIPGMPLESATPCRHMLLSDIQCNVVHHSG